MSFDPPPELRAAIAAFASGVPRAELARRAAALSAAYRDGRRSAAAIASPADVAAYLTTRMPATYAATGAALSAARELFPSFAPVSLLDLCAGAGSASFAALRLWPSIRAATLVDANGLFLDAARGLADAGGALTVARVATIRSQLRDHLAGAAPADLVLMSYALVELPRTEIAAIAQRVFALASGLAVFVEPGTPEGFRRVLACRDALLAAGAHLIAPCPHREACPMPASRWCHFSERLARSRGHRLAKGASLPFEDEPYAYLAVGHKPAERAPAARLVGRLRLSKVEARAEACMADGRLADLAAPRRDRDDYARLRRLDWGDAVIGSRTG